MRGRGLKKAGGVKERGVVLRGGSREREEERGKEQLIRGGSFSGNLSSFQSRLSFLT